MHNKTIALTAVQTLGADLNRVSLSGKIGESVTVGFTKRDGTVRTMTGEVLALIGKDDKAAVVVRTDKGERSANLWAIHSIR